MDLGLAGRVAIVTGGSRGIGLACARQLATEGAHVVLVARGAEALEHAAGRVRAAGPATTVLPIAADTTDDASVRAMVDRAVSELGGVDVLVNAAAPPAGGGPVPALADLTDEAVLDAVDTKVVGYLRTARAVAPHMTAQGWGRIVNVSGLNARRTGSIAGTVRNVGVAALTANLADELGPRGVGVVGGPPGLHGDRADDRDRWPTEWPPRGAPRRRSGPSSAAGTSLRRIITAEEVADVVVFLASPRAIAVTGDAIGAGGGERGVVHY